MTYFCRVYKPLSIRSFCREYKPLFIIWYASAYLILILPTWLDEEIKACLRAFMRPNRIPLCEGVSRVVSQECPGRGQSTLNVGSIAPWARVPDRGERGKGSRAPVVPFPSSWMWLRVISCLMLPHLFLSCHGRLCPLKVSQNNPPFKLPPVDIWL